MSGHSDSSQVNSARPDGELTIRMLSEADLPALRRLAGRDSAVVPDGPTLGALLDGKLVAALALAEEAATVADPFLPTREATRLLELRAEQLHGPARRSRRISLHRRHGRRARGALAGSPPGGGSRLLQL